MLNNIDITTDVITGDNINYSSGHLVSKINNFHVLCIYDHKGKLDSENMLKALSKDIVKGYKTGVPLFSDRTEAETFIISEQSYQENKELFFKLRIAARNDLTFRIATTVVSHFLQEYGNIIGTSMQHHSKLKDKTLLDTSIQKIESLLRQETFLANHQVWDDFCTWFKSYLTSWIITDMEKTIGFSELEKLDTTKLNTLFYDSLTKQIQSDSAFMVYFRKIVEQHIQDWVKKIIFYLDVESITINEIQTFLELNEYQLPIKESRTSLKNEISFTTLIDDENLLVMSNAVYQSVRESLSNKRFESVDHATWPTAQISKGTIEGTVQLIPYNIDTSDLAIDQILIRKSWFQAYELSELDVDVFDALCSFFLAHSRHRKDIVEIYLDDLLAIRGLKPKLSGSGRRGGYGNEQRSKVLKALSKIQDLWINLEKAVVYEKGKPTQMKLEGRAFIFLNQDHNEYNISDRPPKKKLMFTVDEVFARYLNGSGRQVALLPIRALQYNPYQKVWEKRLIRYLSWRWRTQARKGDYLQPHKIGSLFDAIGKKMNGRTPSRTRERLEQALDTLLEDGVIASWQYEKWDESIMSNHGWARIWTNSTVLIDPPERVKEQYRPITRTTNVRGTSSGDTAFSSGQEREQDFGHNIKTIRKKLGLTLLQAAEELEISASYLSNIERSIKTPSKKINRRMTNWLHRYEGL